MLFSLSITFPCSIKSISSSGKSKHASTNTLNSISFFSKSLILLENLPESDWAALLTASIVVALITSITDSACAKSILLFK